jgi:hypothetical protein
VKKARVNRNDTTKRSGLSPHRKSWARTVACCLCIFAARNALASSYGNFDMTVCTNQTSPDAKVDFITIYWTNLFFGELVASYGELPDEKSAPSFDTILRLPARDCVMEIQNNPSELPRIERYASRRPNEYQGVMATMVGSDGRPRKIDVTFLGGISSITDTFNGKTTRYGNCRAVDRSKLIEISTAQISGVGAYSSVQTSRVLKVSVESNSDDVIVNGTSLANLLR